MEETWKTILGYEGLYEVSSLGSVKSLHRFRKDSGDRLVAVKERFLRAENTQGYKRVALQKDGKGKHFSVHRLVATAFIPNPENKPSINHIDNQRDNNCVTNLEWCTAKENLEHCIKQGRFITLRGSQLSHSILTESDVIEIRKYLKSQSAKTVRELAKNYGVKVDSIRQIAAKTAWKHVLD